MAQRIRLIWSLLSPDGTLFVHIDDNELGYLIVLCDEIFGRKNRINIITFKQSSASGPKAINPGLVTTCNYLIFYAKDKAKWMPNKIHQAVPRDSRYNNFIANYEQPYARWKLTTLRQAFADFYGMTWEDAKAKFADKLEEEMTKFVLRFRDKVVQPALVRDKDVNESARAALQESRSDPGTVYRSEREGMDDYYFLNGKQLLFYRNKVKIVGGVETSALAASNLWDDLLSNNVHKEGGVALPKGKKPEALLQRVLEFATKPRDLVLDSFLGSGTTASVAHKMGRRWIGIELGMQCLTHCLPRLRNIIDGNDPDGVSSVNNWKGGGGFRYYRLAPSLLEKDKWGNWVVSKEYNAAMLAEAVCKLEGFSYEPSDSLYWQHGHSTERDFIYTTTANLSHDQLQELSDEVGPERSLLVVCSAFRGRKEGYPNLTVKKIPNAVLTRCEWGKDDYSLKVENLPKAPPEPGQQELF
jgi:adenine-specific DNA-methyltransferase